MNRAAVFIPEKLFFKIGEVCDITGVQAHVLRYWESEFPMLQPQKNRAGQRTYRKRDVEMALRIKELLYEDQYTIAGARKRLSSDIRGASKLKVVTPEMTVSNINTEPTPDIPQTAPPVTPQNTYDSPAPKAQASYEEEMHATEPSVPLSDVRRIALRRLQQQLSELLSLLNSDEPRNPTHHK